MVRVEIISEYYDLILEKGMNPTHFINRLVEQHLFPWKFAAYESEIIDRIIFDRKPTAAELEIVHKYLTYEILRDFKKRIYARYEHSMPNHSLDYYMKKLSIACVECNFNGEEVINYAKDILDHVYKKDPDFNLNTYIDNLIRLKNLPDRNKKVLEKLGIIDQDPTKRGKEKNVKRKKMINTYKALKKRP